MTAGAVKVGGLGFRVGGCKGLTVYGLRVVNALWVVFYFNRVFVEGLFKVAGLGFGV